MASALESRVVNAAGLVQGIVLVTFPAASTIFTSSDEYDLIEHRSTAPSSSRRSSPRSRARCWVARLAHRFGTKRVYLAGLVASMVAMGLLVASAPLAGDPAAFPLLLVATAFVGLGFGLTVPTLNTFAAAFHPDRVDRAVLILNALLGLGTALAPVFVAVFVGLGVWWALPVLSVVLLVGLLAVSLRLPLRISTPQAPRAERSRIPDAVLAVRRRGRAVRHLRDDERQLGAAGHDRATGRLGCGRLARSHRVLGHGHRRSAALRGRPAPVPRGARLPAPAVRPRARARPDRRAARRQPGGGRARLRPGRPWVLGTAPADDQLRPGSARHHVDRRSRCDHRVLPARLRHRRLRHRPVAGRGRLAVDPVRLHRRRRARARRLRVRHHVRPSVATT